MSLAVDVAVEGQRLPVARARVAEAARIALRSGRVRHAMLSITFVSGRRMAALNRRHLGHTGSTDVISFAFRRRKANDPVIGDIYIGVDVAAKAAREQKISVREELLRLAIHGTLHVLGHNHPKSELRMTSPMWKLQERLVRRAVAASSP